LTAARLREQLRDQTPAMVAEIEQLVRIDSGTAHSAGVARVIDGVGAIAVGHGFELSRDTSGGLRATLRCGGPGRRLLLLGHADTVWPAGTAAEWPPRQAEGMLSGPGVGDMKACLVMAIHAIAAVAAASPEATAGIGAIELLVVTDEERGSVASRPWIEQRARSAGACFGLEAGWPGGGVVVARGAVGALRVVARGVSAHSAGHEGEGASAVAALAPLVTRLEAFTDRSSEQIVTVGSFHGGAARQVVPEHAELEVDLRAPDEATANRLLDSINRAVAEANHGPVEIEIHGGITRPAFPHAASAGLWGLATDTAQDLGLAIEPVTSRGGSDASFAAALGIPTLDGLGPICHDSCARGERIEIASLADRGALMAGMIARLASRWRAAAGPDPVAQARAWGNVDAPA
jgi:glutamate carboxypeptidase